MTAHRVLRDRAAEAHAHHVHLFGAEVIDERDEVIGELVEAVGQRLLKERARVEPVEEATAQRVSNRRQPDTPRLRRVRERRFAGVAQVETHDAQTERGELLARTDRQPHGQT